MATVFKPWFLSRCGCRLAAPVSEEPEPDAAGELVAELEDDDLQTELDAAVPPQKRKARVQDDEDGDE